MPAPPGLEGPGFWDGPGGGREVLAIGGPLILSQLSLTLQITIDRVFLTWYSTEAMAGAVTGLFLTLAITCLFSGTGEYLTTFIAQYLGAGRPERIGVAVWQGIHFSLGAGVVTAAVTPWLAPLLALSGHPASLRAHEVAYSRVLLLGGGASVLLATLASFFAGVGRTRAVLIGNLIATAVNVALDYGLIFGRLGLPEWGVRGAAVATVLSQVVGTVYYLVLIFGSPANQKRFALLPARGPERELMARLLRFGLPTGLQLTAEIGAFAVFLVIVGRIGTAELAASGIAFNLNTLVFLPMIGMAIGVGSLVGRFLGAERPDLAERATWTALRLCGAFAAICIALYLGAPRLLLVPYAAGAHGPDLGHVADLTVVTLRYVALYTAFDCLNVVFSAALRGAGDTRFPLVLSTSLAIGTMLVPAFVGCVLLGGGIHVAWGSATVYVALLGVLVSLRFRGGRWKRMRVIEPSRT